MEATVFTLTTHFTYAGDGTRVAVEVEGVGTTTYIPDRGRILIESTATTSTRYLYGRDCLGEVRDGVLLYYLADGQGYVRQSTDEDGVVVDAWLFTPDGGVLAGPEGPVSHLVCGGVYDWSTGLLYRGGRYFDPTLGIWLALGPLVVVQGWRERRKRKGKKRMLYCVLLLVIGVGLGSVLIACNGDCKDPPRDVACVEWNPLEGPAGDRVGFYGPEKNTPIDGVPFAAHWEEHERRAVQTAVRTSLEEHYGGPCGFGSVDAALSKFQATSDSPIFLIRDHVGAGAAEAGGGCRDGYLAVRIYDQFFASGKTDDWLAVAISHELAHYWDALNGGNLSSEMQKSRQGDPLIVGDAVEDFGWTITHYFYPLQDQKARKQDKGRYWCDDRGLGYMEPPPESWDEDRFDYLGSIGFNAESCSCKAGWTAPGACSDE